MARATWQVFVQLAPWMLFGAAVAGLVHIFLPRGFVRRQLRGPWGVGKAVVLGVPLPLCSCGVIPAGLGLRRDGADRGATVGFLISTPQTGVDSLLVSAAFLGWPFALFKVASALVTGLAGGLLTHAVDGGGDDDKASGSQTSGASGTAKRRPSLRDGLAHSLSMVREIWPWLVVGVLGSAAITAYVPKSALVGLGDGVWPMLAALVVSLPLYVCATASVPIAAALVAAGMPPGAALVFLMAGPASNIATIGAVYSALGARALAAYLASIIVGSVALGSAFGAILPSAELARGVVAHAHAHGVVAIGSALLLSALVAVFAAQSAQRWLSTRRVARELAAGAGDKAVARQRHVELEVDGMTCGGCADRLQGTLSALDGVSCAVVDFENKRAVVDGGLDEGQLRAAIRAAGFQA